MESTFNQELNQEQKNAIETSMSYQCNLIISGPGSGKTKTFSQRFLHLIENKVNPHNILAITFTNQAAREMKNRITPRLNESIVKTLSIRTFHSFFANILRSYGHKQGINTNFIILSQNESLDILKTILNDNHMEITDWEIKVLEMNLMTLKEKLITIENFKTQVKTREDEFLLFMYTKYQNFLEKKGFMDFADLHMKGISLFKDPEIREAFQKKYPYVMVDEFQDVNKSQMEFLKDFVGDTNNLFVVGDLNQSIYRFRGSNPKFITQFKDIFPNAHINYLSNCYRCSPIIIEAANALINQNENNLNHKIIPVKKQGYNLLHISIKSTDEQQKAITKSIKDLIQQGLKYTDIAILSRTHSDLELCKQELKQENIPYHFLNGMGFWRASEVNTLKNIIFLTKYSHLNDPYKFILKVTPKVGPSTIKKIETIVVENRIPWEKAIEEFETNRKSIKIGLNESLETIATLKQDLLFKNPKEVLTQFIEKYNFLKYFNPLKESTDDREKNVHLFLDIIEDIYKENQKDYSIETLINEIKEREDNNDIEKGINLATVHGSKGLEFKIVIIPNCRDGNFPFYKANTKEDIEEERRLFYVALTRAEELVIIFYPEFYTNRRGEIEPSIESRFLKEIPESLFDRRRLNLHEEQEDTDVQNH